jgi:predicted O-methyltransferase YrrM
MGPGGPRGAASSQFLKPPVPRGATEKAILVVLNDMDSQRRGMMNVPAEGGRFLRLNAETIGAKSIVEIGTSNGYSGIWQCLALKATGGKLTTFEIDAQRAALARENFKKAGVSDLVTLIEGDAHEKVAQVEGPVDMAFIDADKEGYIDYLNKLLPKMRPGGLILAHNITQGMADPKFIEAITANPDVETLFFAEGGGFSVTMKKHDLK